MNKHTMPSPYPSKFILAVNLNRGTVARWKLRVPDEIIGRRISDIVFNGEGTIPTLPRFTVTLTPDQASTTVSVDCMGCEIATCGIAVGPGSAIDLWYWLTDFHASLGAETPFEQRGILRPNCYPWIAIGMHHHLPKGQSLSLARFLCHLTCVLLPNTNEVTTRM